MSLPLPAALLLAVLASGESIYRTGTAAGGEITAAIAGGDVRVSAVVVACASCHGANGRGGTEGGVVAPDIRWRTLSKPYPVTTANGRRRAPYTPRLLSRAIAMGIDSSGNTLAPLMPRYHMSSEQNDALIAWLRTMDEAKVPGVSDDAIRVGVVLPPAEPLPGLAASFRSVIAAFFEEASRRGGVYGRRLDPVFLEPQEAADARGEAVRRFVRENDVLALAPAFTDGAEETLAKVADEEKVLLMASVTSRPASSRRSYTWLRDLYAGTAEQAGLLASYAVQHLEGSGPISIVAAADSPAADATTAELRRLGAGGSRMSSWPQRAGTVIFLGDEELWRRRGEAKTILVPAALVTPSLLENLRPQTRVFIALPATLQDLTPDGVALWKKLAPPASPWRATQLAALATATLFVHALERAGRDVTRESLLRAIDGVNRLQTGFSPPLTFGPDRHIGSVGAWIVEATAPAPRAVWIEPGEQER